VTLVQTVIVCVRLSESGFGGLVVSVLASGTQDRGFEPGRTRLIFRANQSSAFLPSEGKQSRRSHVAHLRHVKEPCDLRGSLNHRPN
jgi:P pilus assembly chaperone PapD